MSYFHQLADEFKDENIAFVAISLDDDVNRWNNFLDGSSADNVNQLFGGGGFQSPIAQYFKVSGIPRFILLDPQGRIVKIDMNRPSDPATKALLQKHLES